MDQTLTLQEMALAAKCLDIARAKGAQKARITLNKSCMDLIGTLNGEVDKVSHCLDRSISIALFVDGKFGSFSINRLEESALEDFVERAVATARLLAEDPCRDLPDPARTASDAGGGRELGLYDESCLTMDSGKRLALALGASVFKQTAPGDGWTLLSEEAEYSDSVFDTLVMDTQGLRCRHTETSFEYGVEMTIADARGNKFSGYWWNSTPRLSELGAEGICAIALQRAVGPLRPLQAKDRHGDEGLPQEAHPLGPRHNPVGGWQWSFQLRHPSWRGETPHLLALRDFPKEVEHLAPPHPLLAHRDSAPPWAATAYLTTG